jgi:hypothetical protein
MSFMLLPTLLFFVDYTSKKRCNIIIIIV